MQGPRYYDVRHLTGAVTHIDIDNTVVESAGTSYFDTAVIRVLGSSGWGILTVDNYRGSQDRSFKDLLESALRSAEITTKRVELADVPREVLPVPSMKEDPAGVSIEEKTGLLAAIETHARIPEVVSTRATYLERVESVCFEDSSGFEYSYAICRSGFNILAVASRAGVVQMGYDRAHTISGLNLRHREEVGLHAAETAVSLLDAGAVRGGTMNAVLDPELAGVFAHEAVGHASEGDAIQEGSSVLAGMTGERIGSALLTIVDDPGLHEFGFEPVDAEGVKVQRTEIIREGTVAEFLHNRETLAVIGHGVAGHARAMPGDPPLVRMSNTFIENGDASYDELIAECRNGILLKGSRGGQVDPGRGVFQFNAEFGYLIERGEIGRMVRDVSLSGEIRKTLHSIVLCGDDRAMHQGYCGKGGQSVPVSDGAPHVLLFDAVVGGSGMD